MDLTRKTNTNWQLATGLTKTNQLPTGVRVNLDKQEVRDCDLTISQFPELITPQFYKWYCKAYYSLGRELFSRLAAEARADGKPPAKLFSYLIKKALKDQLAGGAPQAGPTTILMENGGA